MSPELSKAIEFLREIGLSVEIRPGASGFVSGVRIVHGGLEVDPQCSLSNLLHEAGHLACTPRQYRPLMDGNLYAGQRAMLEDIASKDLSPDSAEYRAVMQCSDPEATAWAWAAGRHLGLPEEVIIQDDEYNGDGPGMRTMLALNSYVGIHGLAHAGFCCTRSGLSKILKLPAYPQLAFWLQN